jgi:pimeloyl-ACP methyl ester carboxylesterase
MSRALACWCLLGVAATAGAQTPAPLKAEAFTLKSYDGRERAAERVRLSVPADPAQPEGRRLDLAFIRLRPTAAATRPPIVFLMGGPGIPATAIAPIPPYFTLFGRLAEAGDVILLDQRGLGESAPKSDCPAAAAPLAPDVVSAPDKLLAAFAANYKACAASLAPGVLPADLTIDRVAGDVERIRQALGVPQVDLLGFSFGTRVALEVLRHHPDRVRRVVLQGVLGLDTVRQPAMEDAIFRRWAAIADAQAQARGLAPSVEGAVKAIHARLDKAPMALTIQSVKGEPRQVALERAMFDAVVLGHLGDDRLPAALTAAAAGDDSLFRPWVQSLFQDLEKGAGTLMARVMICSSASPPESARRAAQDAPAMLLGEPLDNAMQGTAFCQAFGVTPPAAQPAVRSTVPALLINGTLDARTPPDRAAATAAALTASEHVIVENGGHELLPIPAVQDLVLAFLDGRLERKPIAEPVPEMRTIEDARKPPQRRGG